MINEKNCRCIMITPKNRSLKNYAAKALKEYGDVDKEVIEARGEDVPFLVEKMASGDKEVIGMTGFDLFKEYQLKEYNSKLRVIKKIAWEDKQALFGKPVLCLLGPKNKDLSDFPKNLRICINSKYRNISKKYLNLLEEKGYSFEKMYVSGSTETVYNGISDLIIDIVYSGRSMEDAGLKMYDKIMESDFVVIGAEPNSIKPKESVEKMSQYDPPTADRKGKLRLDFNENTIGCSQKVLESLRSINAEDIAMYPEYSGFVKRLASYLDVEPSELLLTNGTDEAIKLVMDTFLDNNEEIIIPSPTFSLFELYASVAGAKITKIMYNEDLSFPADRALASISDKTKMVVLVNPNNPTGSAIKEEDIIKIAEKAKNSIVLIDEAYYQYYGKSSKRLIKEFSNVVITQTFSKAFGLAGLRLGYIIADKNIVKTLKKAISPYSVNSLALVAGYAALEDADFVNGYSSEVKISREWLKSELERLGIRVFPSEANFLIADFGDKCGYVYEKLKEKGILVRDRSRYPLLKNCLRAGIGTMEQSSKLVGEIKKILREKTILFDMDGVLVDVSDSYRSAIKETAEFFTNSNVSEEEVQAIKEQSGYNNDWDATEAIIAKKGANARKEDIISKFQELYLGKGGEKGFIENERLSLKKDFLEDLYGKYRLGIVTGRPKEEAYLTLKKFGIMDFFDVIIAMEDYPKDKAKPDPYPVSLALRKLEANDAVYIGDNVDDIKAAISANIEAIGIIPKNAAASGIRRLLLQNGAKCVLEDINKIEGELK